MQTLLDRMDRTSMYSGLEARVPFADHRIMAVSYTHLGLCYSPITGSKGNIEYLICMKKGEDNKKIYDVKKIVSEAFLNFNVKK